MFGSFVFFVSASLGIIWSLPFLLTALLGITLNKLSGRNMTCFLSKHVRTSSLRMNNQPMGWVSGKWFIGYVYETTGQHGSVTQDLFLLIGQKQLALLSDGVDVNTADGKHKMIDFFEREGLFWDLRYAGRPISPPTEDPWEPQKRVVDQIIVDFLEKKYTTVLLTGKPGVGKSMIALYVCKRLLAMGLGASLVDTWNPTDPGDVFAAIYNKINPSEKKPLVVVLEEVDGILMAIHRNEIKISTMVAMPIPVKTKTDWNQLLDRFDRKMYPGVILVLTTNKTLEWFNEMDPSYTRKGRINLHCEVAQ